MIRIPHPRLVAGAAAFVMLGSNVASVFGILALHEPLRDLTLWPAVGSFVVAGWLLAVRRPGNAVGWLLLMTAAGLSFLPWSVLSAWMITDGVALGKWTAGLSNGSFVLDVGGLALLLPLLFPDGRLPSAHRWWRIVLWADVGYMFFAAFNLFSPGALDLPAYDGVVPNPYAAEWIRPIVGPCISLAAPMMLIGFAGSFSALVVRWRSSGAALRAQMKWVIVALVCAPVPFILHDWAQGVSDTLMTFVLPLVPIAIAVSVLKYRLYDIDRVISRAVGYLFVTGLLVGVYVGCIALADALLPVGSSFAVAASTLAAAALFQPLRRRVQLVVDRRFDRSSYDARQTVESFSNRLRDEVDVDAVQAQLVTTVSTAVAPASLSLWVAT